MANLPPHKFVIYAPTVVFFTSSQLPTPLPTIVTQNDFAKPSWIVLMPLAFHAMLRQTCGTNSALLLRISITLLTSLQIMLSLHMSYSILINPLYSTYMKLVVMHSHLLLLTIPRYSIALFLAYSLVMLWMRKPTSCGTLPLTISLTPFIYPSLRHANFLYLLPLPITSKIHYYLPILYLIPSTIILLLPSL